jgi:hypothetical protein
MVLNQPDRHGNYATASTESVLSGIYLVSLVAVGK